MSLLSRLVSPAPGEAKLPAHQFMAALSEMKRGAPGINPVSVGVVLDLSPQEQTELLGMVFNHYNDGISRDLLHDVLMLGEADIYTLQQCADRLVNVIQPVNLFALTLEKRVQLLAQGYNECVLSGCQVTAQVVPDLTLAVEKGAVLTAGVLRPVTAGVAVFTPAHPTLPRIDVVVADAGGLKQVREGIASSRPQPPVLNQNDVALAFVYVPPAFVAIGASQLLDARVLRTTGPIVIRKVTSPVVNSNSSAALSYLTITVPNGLLLAGRILRVRCGGTMLLSSGTPTLTLTITYGGTTMFQDVTGAATADVDRLAWALDFNVVAQNTSSDQALNGILLLTPLGAKTAPATGIGDIANATALVNPVNGASAVDSDTADRALVVQWAMSVANAANEIVMEYATGELL